jgi:predicted nucleic acid-binding protein
VIFVDTSVVMYAVGRRHPLREPARAFVEDSARGRLAPLCTSAEVLQELLHAYLPVGRIETLDAAFALVDSFIPTVHAVEPDDVRLARDLAGTHPALDARDLLHLATCRRREISRIKTFDGKLAAAFEPGRR